MIYDNGTGSLADILDVGEVIDGRGFKMVGYKTLRDLSGPCGLAGEGIAGLKERVRRQGHETLVLPKGEDSDVPWALYAYAPRLLSPFLEANASILHGGRWPRDCEGFVRRLAADWVPWGTPLRRLIDVSFGNFAHEQSRSDMSAPAMAGRGLQPYR